MSTERQTVDIELGGVTLTLTRTPEAVIAISDAADGLAPAIAAIGRLNVYMMATVINAALGRRGEVAKETAKAVGASNLLDLSKQLTDFMILLTSGTAKA
ncbi:MAG: hypothetical protein EOS36_14885 [Mesorhizobium sp.]|uniref:hypothetical protein n=1 Tax=Mesorhizobium sp. TaxID=1871066 RepID=UPI000FE50179|nr:hypothetical protein [Mesorhizobium sp.]RWD62546.1 MAG: hypothetical protein EOS36_14885 [Mesorhizobium sp.]RWE39605.1 MAG: hypothetical protein EOS79_20490 [Mesorhizobium sp.]